MLRWLVERIETVAAHPRRIGWTALVFATTLIAMLALGRPFERATGHAPLDFQATLSVADIRAQIPRYDARARRIYVAISVLDFVFPPAAALLWASLMSAGLRAGWPRWYERWRWRGLLALPFVGTLADGCENVANLILTSAAPRVVESAATLSVWAKQVKMTTVTPSVTGGLVVMLVGFVAAWLKSRAGRPAP